jgi:hypothetical protein
MSAFWLIALLLVALIACWAIFGGYLSAGEIGVKRDWRTLADQDEEDHPSAK